ncbi:hypothetical protein PYW07_000022 [Mythimna separata]|uniref:Mitochondrial processing peptidase beta subunit n=1 Tax=Mythimna separata TaxID=271217 RepID=A0AAD8E047_MYTSE|nr:hypothetical protein PYW07_000022 [Mythimna separata]
MFKSILKSVNIRVCKTSARRGSGAARAGSFTQTTTLSNELKVATQLVPSPLACVTLSVAGGPRYETAATNGLTHFVEHLAFKGSRCMNEEQFKRGLIDMDARMTVHTSREQQVFSVEVKPECAARAVDMLYNAIADLDLNDSKVHHQRENICRELADADADPKEVLFDYLHATAFQGTPLAQRVIGPTENLQRFDANIVTNFICENYTPYRLCLATAGQADHNAMVYAAGTTFGKIEAVPPGEPEQGPDRFSGSQIVFREDSMPFCHAAITFEAPGYCSPDYYKMLVLQHMMGSWERSQGRGAEQAAPVAQWVALDRLCEHYEPIYLAYRDIGLWGVYFVADKWKLDEIVSSVQEQWMNMCIVLTAKEVARGCNLAKMSVAREYASAVRSAHALGRQMLYGCPRVPLDEVFKCLEQASAKQLRALADRLLYDRCPAVAVVGPSETMPDYLRIRSGMWWLRL